MFECFFCGKSFKTKKSQVTHFVSQHSVEKCKLCGTDVVSWVHYRTDHKYCRAILDPCGMVLGCELCDYFCYDETYMIHHMRTVHGLRRRGDAKKRYILRSALLPENIN